MPRALVSTKALLLRRTEYRDADLLLVVMTEQLGKLTVLARAARNSRRRFAGALEPMHELSLELSQTEHSISLESAQISDYRSGLTKSLERMQLAGRALAWVRDATPEGQSEPEVWRALNSLLAQLNTTEDAACRALLASAGLQLLQLLGWGLQLDCCVRCDRICKAGKAAAFDPALGGLICGNCGGARYTLSGDERRQLQALSEARVTELEPAFAARTLSWVDAAFAFHAHGRSGKGDPA